VKNSPQLPMLVDFEYNFFFGGSFGLEIWHTYNQLKDNALVNILWENTNF
jgi:hypothetical protein